MLQQNIVISVILSYAWLLSHAANAAANIELANMWLHHEMDPFELSHHFGVQSSHQVDPDMYQLIKIQNEGSSKTKRSSWNSTTTTTISFFAFGERQQIQLEKNTRLMSKDAKVYVTDGLNKKLPLILPEEETDCHFLHNSELMSAALTQGKQGNYLGHVIHQGQVFEIKPLHDRFQDLLEDSSEDLHIITRRPVQDLPEFDETFEMPPLPGLKKKRANFQTVEKRSGGDLTIETAVFLDPTAYRSYLRYFRGDTNKVTNMILAFMNGVQAIYHFKSLRRRVDFTIVHMELLSSSPFQEHRGERERLLTEFCKYQSSQNVPDDSDPRHWDIALDLSGLDFYAASSGSYVTMGLATVTGICDKLYNCVIGEIGVTNSAGKPYPSAGFTSVFVMAHEIGHNLGMHHDGSSGCASNGFVMSASRGTKGEVTWSSCSANVVGSLNMDCLKEGGAISNAEWDHENKYNNMPGLKWSSDEQCQFLLKDPEAKTDHSDADLPTICTRLYCKSPTRTGYFAAGPALEGTRCSKSPHKVCHEGECSSMPQVPKPSNDKPKWSGWSDFSVCQNGCIQGGIGYQTRSRYCIYPQQANVDGCHGPAIQVRTCNNPQPCDAYQSPNGFASAACQTFMDKNTRLSIALLPEGKQLPHKAARPDQACTVYCKQVRSPEWLSPQMYFAESDDIDLYFPDGTLCHNDGSQSYYCLKHQCVPADQSRTPRSDNIPEVEIFQNALPNEPEADPKVLDFFSADDSGQHLNEAPPPSDREENKDDEFEQDDEVSRTKRSARHENDRLYGDYEYEQHELERTDFHI